ncbi:FeoA family protein [Coxiella-like endosymbiont of Amblyomma americanum]|uniref:FeoA family protein n=1 Tax=Coxiella-like endosymbiont of Amblyomma americanum TaxID=1987500 RepID=UPI00058026D5|nr:FeoA family protein [Coxiella-like endosymbiont of Amblyomma americanum]AJC50178.1 iron transporter FeoA [Coxiella endosymbiont of Amblyomma americanum]AUJ58538.1 ferrous iron transport protein A [Coxiella-like endosymbiont of Amblyomma americanum]
MLILSDLRAGDIGRVCGYYTGNIFYRQKLLAMGLVPNTQFLVIRKAPLGDPIQIQVRNFYLILRKDEAMQLIIEQVFG